LPPEETTMMIAGLVEDEIDGIERGVAYHDRVLRLRRPAVDALEVCVDEVQLARQRRWLRRRC
jgi:hypothetical protein